MVPFSFRLLFAELPQHNGRPNLALDRLYSLQKIVSTIRENLSKGFREDGSKSDIYNEEELKGIAQIFAACCLFQYVSSSSNLFRTSTYGRSAVGT